MADTAGLDPVPVPERLKDDPVFRRWAAAQVVNVTGTVVSATVLPILVFQLTRSVLLTSLLAATEVVPYLVFGLVAGPVADQVSRRALMLGGYWASAVTGTVLPVAGWIGRVPVGLVFGCALAMATLFVFTDAAAFGAYPMLIGRERLPAASGAINSATGVSAVVVPSLAAAAAARWGATPVLLADAMSYAVAAILLARISRPFGLGRPGGAARSLGRVGSGVTEGLRYIWSEPVMRLLLMVGFANSLAFGSVRALTVIYGVQALHLTLHSPWIGGLYSAGAAGSLIASLLFARFYRARAPAALTSVALSGAAIALSGLAVVTVLPAAAALLVVFWFAAVTVVTTGITYRQTTVPSSLLSRVNVAGRMIAWGGQPAGAAAVGALAAAAGVRAAFWVTAAIMAAAAIACATTHRSRQRAGRAPAGPAGEVAARPPGGRAAPP
jgi:hypothetical protein